MQINFNTTGLDILPTDESYRYRSIMGEHTLTLYFSLPTYTDIPTGAWCEFQGERYTLNQPAKVVKHNTHHFEYTLTMDSEGANLRNYKLRNPNDKTLKFPFTASPRYHIQILVDCLNMIDSGWQVGTTIEAFEKLVSYNHNNCLEALDMIAKAFETEYEIIGKTIHLHKVEYFKDNPLPLQYGKGKGFKTGVSRTTEQSRITRLYVQGGERNIDRSKYGNKELLLPKSQEYTYEGVTFVSDDKGLSIAIKNAQNNGFVNEQSLDLSHIYPKRKGTITEVFEVNHDKHFCDFTDTSIPQALNFWDMRINGEKMVIYFESGMLSGREFDVQKYDHTQKRFQLVPKEEDGTTMPNDIFKPAIGDEYSVYNMQMPNAYICDNATKSGASWEMMKEACKYLYENRADLFTFTGELDGIWAKKQWTNVGGRLKMGAYIHFSDNEFQRTPVAIRIVGLKEYVNNPYSPQIELSNKVQGHSFASEMRKLQNQEVYFGELNKKAISETKRSWRDAQETIKQIEEAFPEYTKNIIPATVQTMMALIGNKSTQFDFVVSKANPIKAPHTLYFDKNTKQINAGSGWLKHFTLGSSDITPNRDTNSYKYWNIPAFVSGRLDDKAKTYYLYIKASKASEIGEFILSENKIDIEQEAGYYHFLYATVNSEYNGERGIAQLNGFTEITGGQIKTDKITSGNGQQYIHLFDDHIEIKANLKITDGNKTEIKQLVNPDLLSLENRLKQYTTDTNTTLETKLKEYANKGEIYLRGTGLNRHAAPIIQINGQNVVPDNYRGLYLAVIRRSDLQVIFKQNYDTFANDFDDSNKLADYLNGLNSDVLVALVSRDSFTQGNNNGKKFVNALISCGANDDNSKFVSRMPYAFLGIPNISKGNGIEVYTSDAGNAPYAEIATKIINGTPQGMNNVFNGMLQAEQQARTQAINEANANTNAKFQEAKTFAEQKVNELNIGGRNLILNTTSGQVIYQLPLTKLSLSSQLEIGKQYTISWKGKMVDNYLDNWVAVQRLNAWEHSPDEVMIRERINSVEEKLYSYTFTAKNSSERPEIGIWIWGKVSIGSLKLEKGNKPTDWTPAPEDLEAQIQTERQSREQAIATAKTATEAYARTQSELTKAQAIAEANKQAGIALTAEQQARILQLQQNLQQAKTFAEQKVNDLNIGGRNLIKGTANFELITEPFYLQSNYAGNGGVVSETFRGNKVVKLTSNWQGFQCRTTFEDLPMIISFWAKTTRPNIKIVCITDSEVSYNSGRFLIADGVWHRYVISKNGRIVTANPVRQGFVEFCCTTEGKHIEEVYVSSFKFEYGNTPTDWTAAPEDLMNNVTAGGRNLVLNSKVNVTNNTYGILSFLLSEEPKVGEQLTITVKGELGAGKRCFTLYNKSGHQELCVLQDKGNGIFQSTFNWLPDPTNPKLLVIYVYDSSVVVNSTIEWVKVERGDINRIDWSPAPEDIENKVADIQTDLHNAINNAKALVDAERNNRLLTDKRVKAIEDLSEPENGKETAFSKGIKSLQTKTSPFSDTLIDGNVVATGTMIVGNSMGTQAGISGVGIADNDIRFWAGSNYKDRSKAPFYVLQDGSIYASKGQIGHFTVESAAKTSLRANDLQIESGGLIRSRGQADNSRNTVVLINEKGTLNEPVGTRPAVRIDSYGFNPTSHTGLHVSSIGGRYNAGIVVESSGTGDNPYNSVAIDVRSGYILTSEKTAFLMKGKAIFEETYVGTAYSNTISLNIAKSHTYIFVNIASTIVYLPNRSEIERATGKTNTTFELQILLAHTATQNIRISSQAGGVLLNNSGNPMNDLNLGRGNALILRYYDGYYYIMSHRE